LERLQTKGRTKAETLAKELKETQAMVLVSLHDLRKQELVQQDSGIAIEIEEPF
jgi:hypothetical protein